MRKLCIIISFGGKGVSRHGGDGICPDESGYPSIDFTCRRNELDEPEFFEGTWHVDYRPIGYRGPAAFLSIGRPPGTGAHPSASGAVWLWMIRRVSRRDPRPVPERHLLGEAAGEVLQWRDVSLTPIPSAK